MVVISLNKFLPFAIYYGKPFSDFSLKLHVNYLGQRPCIKSLFNPTIPAHRSSMWKEKKEGGREEMLPYMYRPEMSLIRRVGSKVTK